MASAASCSVIDAIAEECDALKALLLTKNAACAECNRSQRRRRAPNWEGNARANTASIGAEVRRRLGYNPRDGGVDALGEEDEQ